MKQKLAFLLLAVAALAAFTGLGIYRSSHPADFGVFYAAGKIVAHGQGSSLYNWRLQDQVQRSSTTLSSSRSYHRLAWQALLFVPMSALPYRAAYVTWWIVSLLLAGLTLYVLRAEFHGIGSNGRLVFLALLFVPMANCLDEGQDAVLVMMALLFAARALENEHDAQAGALLALGATKFHLLLPLFALLLIKRRWRVLGTMAIGSAALLAVSVAVVGPTLLTDWIHAMQRTRHTTDQMYIASGANVFASFASFPRASMVLAAVIALLGLLLFREADRQMIHFGALYMVGVITQPHSSYFDLVAGVFILVPPLLLRRRASKQARSSAPTTSPLPELQRA